MHRHLSRRTFLAALGAGCAAWSMRSAWGADAAPVRPNFVFILTDDHRWDALGCVQRELGERGRFPWLKTPRLDALAAEGVRFRNAFVVSSLCSPSRAAFLTGQYGHVNGVNDNSTPFPETNTTFATALRAAGYATGYAGKWHMSRQRGPRPGFDFSASYLGQGSYENGPFEVNGKTETRAGWVDDIATDYALQFLRRNRAKPFVLMLGFKAAHAPFTPPARHANTFAGGQVRPAPSQDTRAIYGQEGAVARPAREAAELNYFRCLAAADDNVGRVLDELKTLGVDDRTMVIFAGDNGFYRGEHGGLKDKRTAYEESMRIPLLLKYPPLKKAGAVEDRLVLNVDLMPTLLEYAGVPVPAAVQGRSWRPLLEGPAPQDWRRSFLYYYARDPSYPAVPPVIACRTESAKLIRYPDNAAWTEVFDLRADPYETRNLAAVPEAAGLRRELELGLDEAVKTLKFDLPNKPVKERKGKKAS